MSADFGCLFNAALCVSVFMHRGVSMFAMLTGTLPFTVEPFNIKQLHLKMVNGEISVIPSDISKGKMNGSGYCILRCVALATH